MRTLDLVAEAKIREGAVGEAGVTPRHRALAKIALIEARLDLPRATRLRASGYYEKIVRRFERT